MNRRSSEILMSLIESGNKGLNITEIAESYKVTEKTVRNDIEDINYFLKKNRLNQIALLGNGHVRFEGSAHDVKLSINENFLQYYRLEKSERQLIVSLLLALSTGYVTISSLAKKVYVSRSTLLNDLKSIKVFLLKNDLHVSSYPNKGLLVEGSEYKRRILAAKIVSGCLNEKTSLVFRKANFNPYEVFFLNNDHKKELKEIIEKLIIEVTNLYNIQLTDISFKLLSYYLLISVIRIKSGYRIKEKSVYVNRWKQIVKELSQRISQYCDVGLNRKEEDAVSYLFGNLKYLKKRNENAKIVTLQIITRKFIEQLSNELGIDLNDDYKFFENLVNHLESFTLRKSIEEPLDIVFNESCPDFVYRAVEKKVYIIQEALNKEITETELKYIALHVCAAIERKKYRTTQINVLLVCGSGVSTSQLLKVRLRNYFNFNFVDTISRHNLNNITTKQDELDIDLIISTVPLGHNGKKYIVINPELTREDIIRIYDAVEGLKKTNFDQEDVFTKEKSPHVLVENILKVTKKHVKKITKQFEDELIDTVLDFFKEEKNQLYLYELLKPEFIQLDVEANSYIDAIRKSAYKLLKYGFIEERYIEAMIRNVQKYGPYIIISEGFAVPHAGIHDGSNSVGMNLIRLKKPVDFMGNSVKYFCTMSVIDAKTHLNAFFDLVNILKIPEFKKKLDQAETAEEVNHIIKIFELEIIF